MVAPPGRTWLIVLGAVDTIAMAGFLLTNTLPWLIGAIVVVCFLVIIALFFRDPERTVSPGVVAAADGRVMMVEREGGRVRIGTFMNVTDVHVNRVPLSGYLVRVDSREGTRVPAFSPKAKGNAQKRYLCGTPIGLVEVVQITGLIARRCVSYKERGEVLRKGERLGMVLLGSRVDVVLPLDQVKVMVGVGDAVSAGSTRIAEITR